MNRTTFDLDISEMQQALRRMQGIFTTEEKLKVLNYAIKPFVDAAQRGAPQSRKSHYRYDTPKLARSVRAPNGQGKRVATYLPGNMKMSVSVLKHGPFRKLKNVVYAGVKVSRRNARGTFGARKFDGFYAHWVEYGTRNMKAQPFMRPAWRATKGMMLNKIQLAVKLRLNRFNRTGR